MKVKAIVDYYDKVLKKHIAKGEQIEVNEERLAELVTAKVVTGKNEQAQKKNEEVEVENEQEAKEAPTKKPIRKK